MVIIGDRNLTEPGTAVLALIFVVVCFVFCECPKQHQILQGTIAAGLLLVRLGMSSPRGTVPKSTLGTDAMPPRDTGSKTGPGQSLEGSLEGIGESAAPSGGQEGTVASQEQAKALKAASSRESQGFRRNARCPSWKRKLQQEDRFPEH